MTKHAALDWTEVQRQRSLSLSRKVREAARGKLGCLPRAPLSTRGTRGDVLVVPMSFSMVPRVDWTVVQRNCQARPRRSYAYNPDQSAQTWTTNVIGVHTNFPNNFALSPGSRRLLVHVLYEVPRADTKLTERRRSTVLSFQVVLCGDQGRMLCPFGDRTPCQRA
jgi:hypothetical protein